jgi:hypothetical protein
MANLDTLYDIDHRSAAFEKSFGRNALPLMMVDSLFRGTAFHRGRRFPFRLSARNPVESARGSAESARDCVCCDPFPALLARDPLAWDALPVRVDALPISSAESLSKSIR